MTTASADDGQHSRATVRTTHDRPAAVAAALRPDNTAQMDTRVDGDRVVTTIERTTASGLRATLDDYLVNLRVADRLATNTHDTTP